MGSSKLFKDLRPYFAVILMQFGYSGTVILAKSALNQGMNHYSFSVYRNVFATVCFAPFALVLERKIRPRMTLPVLAKIALLAFLEPVLDQNLYYSGMRFTTATFASAMCNVLPAITFLLALAFRIEKVNLKKFRDYIKIMGTVVTISGAMIITLVTGPAIAFPWTKNVPAPETSSADVVVQLQPVKGAIMIATGCICWSLFYILQVNVLKSYPAGLSLTSLICMVGALQGTVLTLVVERKNPDIWSLGWNAKLLACAYAGVVSSGIGYYVSGFVSKEKGPVFSTSFNPLSMVIVAIMSSFIFREQMNVGKVTGAAVIVTGLYLVIWSRMKDHKDSSKSINLDPIDQELSKSAETKVVASVTKKLPEALPSDNNV